MKKFLFLFVFAILATFTLLSPASATAQGQKAKKRIPTVNTNDMIFMFDLGNIVAQAKPVTKAGIKYDVFKRKSDGITFRYLVQRNLEFNKNNVEQIADALDVSMISATDMCSLFACKQIDVYFTDGSKETDNTGYADITLNGDAVQLVISVVKPINKLLYKTDGT